MLIRPERRQQVDRLRSRINEARLRDRYADVEQDTGVPWFVVALIHNLEASQRMDCHLHNGDPLTGRTFHVPARRPAEGQPPFTWRASAADALRMKRLDRWTDWSIPGIAFVLERFNGFGYRNHHPQVKSPYLWSFSNVYRSGKYIRDGVFSETAVSQQCGGMALLRALMDADSSVRQRVAFEVPTPEDEDEAKPFPHKEGPEEENGSPTEPDPTVPPQYPGRYLQFGIEDDPAVLLLQQRLRALAADPGALDGDFGEVTELAVKLFQARSSNLAGEPLEVDGVVGPETWAALFGPESVGGGGEAPDPGEQPPPPVGSLAARVVEVASQEVGVRESPLGSNRGPRVDQFIRAAGLDPTLGSFPWCMCFVFWCYREATRQLGVANHAPRNASVHLAWQATRGLLPGQARVVLAAEARRNPALVQPGMAFFIDTGGGKGHAGLVSANLNGSLETIEGNTTSVTGSREGIGVFRRTRRKISDSSIMGFASYE